MFGRKELDQAASIWPDKLRLNDFGRVSCGPGINGTGSTATFDLSLFFHEIALTMDAIGLASSECLFTLVLWSSVLVLHLRTVVFSLATLQFECLLCIFTRPIPFFPESSVF